MKTKNLTISLFVLLMGLSIGFTSCKKDKIYPIEGNWVGTYVILNTDYFIAFTIKNGGTLDVMDDPNNKSQITASGTWTVTNGQFNATLDYGNGPITTFTAPYDQNNDIKTMTGTWNSIPPGVANTWTMTKQ
jgi:hypothetical protein